MANRFATSTALSRPLTWNALAQCLVFARNRAVESDFAASARPNDRLQAVDPSNTDPRNVVRKVPGGVENRLDSRHGKGAAKPLRPILAETQIALEQAHPRLAIGT